MRGTHPILALIASLLFPLQAAFAVDLATVLVASELTRPLYATAPVNDHNRLFIVEQAGIVRILDISVELPALQAGDFLDITSIVGSMGNEQGLEGLAFHPQYAANGFFFVY